MTNITDAASRLEMIIASMDNVAVALSGGIDSLVLSAISFKVSQGSKLQCTAFHAVSPAVPPQATERVRECAQKLNWNLKIIDANEFDNPEYRRNPVDRCFYCKSSLYGTIRAATNAIILAGTNTNDLLEYRPGLKAADNYNVRHPYVEAEIDKATIRQLAPLYGIAQYAELPAAPCLASRVETGISIEADELTSINAIELFITERFKPKTVRCRLRSGKVVIEVDEQSLPAIAARISEDSVTESEIRELLAIRFKTHPLDITSYRVGSAFLLPAS